MGDVTGDLSSRRGQVTGTQTLQADMLAVNGLAPLSELDGYAARLKSMTGGHGAWTMSLSHYEQAPPNLQQQLATEYAKHRKHEEEGARRLGAAEPRPRRGRRRASDSRPTRDGASVGGRAERPRNSYAIPASRASRHNPRADASAGP